MTTDIFTAGRAFLQREGRLLERRLFATAFEGAPPSGVVDALRGFRNPDGGFGHGLEPDKRCPDSLPIDVEGALEALLVAGPAAVDEATPMVLAACDWLGRVAAPDGAVALSFPVMESYPRAEHWSDWTYAPGLNPTAGLAGRLHRMGVRHPWLDRATGWCWSRLEIGFDEDAHALREVAAFLAQVPDRARAEAVSASVGEWLAKAAWYRADPDDPSYGVTPLDLAPEPDGPWSHLFDARQIEGHLDRLARDQQPDGGWAITWEPPGTASTLEWRGIRTLWALRVLTAYGRLQP
ncbi:MAG: hypothetical protein QOE80_4481 [Actinomycetota bacterium]|nr:hypothetical protein [Actinomycetota bacterium]